MADALLSHLKHVRPAALECSTCSRAISFASLYACRACPRLVCDDCARISVVSYYCPQCLAVYASRQALDLDSRCRRCSACAHCNAPLQIVTNSESRVYLACSHCGWSDSTTHADAGEPVVALRTILPFLLFAHEVHCARVCF
eukprot:TRINITY_DN1649_c0_g8_i1.p1 TRINITY_DN1649_c0_g8~~TRINITY_DN1649_c0_g8_i1.p1  ORF type:complete len:143 (+),score=12.20 TRINITY_DN1649_c0_g8_i1:235-663(+)